MRVNQTGMSLVPGELKIPFERAVAQLRALKEQTGQVLLGVMTPDLCAIPWNLNNHIKILQKHEAVLIMNVKAFVAQAQANQLLVAAPAVSSHVL